MSVGGIRGPFWLENGCGKTTTVNKERYIAILEKFVEELGSTCGGDQGSWWFQQDGASPHTSKLTLAWLEDHFGDRTISRTTEHE